MEKSIKRVEKLVHATSSALAQMKFSLMFDDMYGSKTSQSGRVEKNVDAVLLEKLLAANDLNLHKNEFKLETSEALARLEKISVPNELNSKRQKPIDRIKEINRKMNHLKLEQSRRGETKQSRQKLLSLISEEKFSPGKSSCKESSSGSKQTFPFNEVPEFPDKLHPAYRKLESTPVSKSTKSPAKSKAELKNKILEMQEIVDRGFQTARQLTQKMENMTKWERKDKTPSTGKSVSEINLRSLEGKTESNETMKTVKCRRHSGKNKKKEKDLREIEQINFQAIDVKRSELGRDVRVSLQLQRLPSLHIRGGLKVQKVHNLVIPASEKPPPEKSNTAISFLSHEQVEREKMEKVLDKVRKENLGYFEGQSKTNYVECFNCGKLIRIRETWVNPEKIDEVLQRCDFNVFDPRIDEFVEKYGSIESTKQCEGTRLAAPLHPQVVMSGQLEGTPKDSQEIQQTEIKTETKKLRRFTLQDLSHQLCKKYKEEAEAIADNHLKLDTILRNLFKKVEESKEVFESCHLLKNGRSSTLTATKPVLVSLPEMSLLVKNPQKKLEKNDGKNRSKSRTEPLNEEKFALLESPPDKAVSAKEITQEGVLFFTHRNPYENFEFETEKEALERTFTLPTRESCTRKYSNGRKEGVEELTAISSSNNTNSSSYKGGLQAKEKKIKKTLIKGSAERESRKLLEKKWGVRLSMSKSKTIEGSGSTEVVQEEEKMVSVPPSTSCSSGRKTRQRQAGLTIKRAEEPKAFLISSSQPNSSNPSFLKKETEEKLFVSPCISSNSDREETEKSRFCQTLSEKSENNYESDFESLTIEPEENKNECEDEEPQMNQVLQKLSTISEVDSELEKKLSDEQKSQCPERGGDVECVNPKEGYSVVSSVSVKSKKTELTPTKTVETSLKSTPTELVTSLKDILSALQDQFARTESLAEKLTENTKFERKEKTELDVTSVCEENGRLNLWEMPPAAKLVENLQNSRKNWNSGPKPRCEKSKMPERVLYADDTFEEGGSSLGEVILSEGKKNNSGLSNSSSISEESILNLLSGEDRSSLV